MYSGKDITGQSFGLLTVLSGAGSNAAGKRLWLCRCACGQQTIAQGVNLRRGVHRSCGCTRRANAAAATSQANKGNKYRVKHGLANKHPLYETWKQMLRRCYGPNSTSFAYYGGRGITVCQRWRTSFTDFLADVGKRPSPQHSLDRIDVNGNYEPDNVRWADRATQAKNKRSQKNSDAKSEYPLQQQQM